MISLSSCKTDKLEEIDIVGKWWSYDMSETEYIEYDIDMNSIGVFSQYGGNGFLLSYKISNDTLYFREGEFKVRMISENQFTITIRDKTDTLTRLPDSLTTFHTIKYKDDSIFNSYYTQFTDRAYDCWIKYGYVTEEELKNSFIEADEIEDKIIPINKK